MNKEYSSSNNTLTVVLKWVLILVVLLFSQSTLCNAQPKSIQYQKENDFFMNIIYNPSFSLYDFLTIGLHSKNTDLKELGVYLKSNNARTQCQKLNINITETYRKVKAAWKVFLEVENTDLSVNGFGKYMLDYSPYNIYAPKNCPNPELKHKLSIVPLKLEEY